MIVTTVWFRAPAEELGDQVNGLRKEFYADL